MNGRTVRLPRGSSDAALAPYHVDRSKLFVLERLDSVEQLDADRVARAIEYTRFPYTMSSNDSLIEEEGLLLRAAVGAALGTGGIVLHLRAVCCGTVRAVLNRREF